MTNREIMLSALKNTVIKELKSQGFIGTYPNFKKITSDGIELICFQTNKYGGSFTVEVSAVFPDSKVTNLSNMNALVDEKTVNVSCTNQRYRLKGMYDGWFYYRDVYKLPNGFYRDISEKEAETFSEPDNWNLLQCFDEKIAYDICDEINLQLEDAFEWLFKLKQKHNKKYKKKPEPIIKSEKVTNKRIFGFVIGFFTLSLISLVLFVVNVKGLSVAVFLLALLQIVFILIKPISYIFSEDKLIIRYLFNKEENIPWQHVRAITSDYETIDKYLYLYTYKFYYYSKDKRPFYMQGIVSKNSTTEKLMDKYCPKKH